ncbi:MAG TPA: hypothetical protein PKE19_00035, partial [Aestuariivirga sp.]|nr:hypothetical protein [Aestuariivirga sp.]
MAKSNEEAVEVAQADAPKILSIKGMDRNMQCRGFQFAVGETYSVDSPVKVCEAGFHACPIDQHPLSVFEFYPPGTSRFFEVAQFGDCSKADTKLASASITINAEISLSDLAARAVKWVFDRAVWSGAATASGDSGAATASGD